MRFIQVVLYPFSMIYGLLMSVRNLMYHWGVIHSCKPDIPVICVGNLSYGGTGKTPHVEYLIRLLKEAYRISTLSRGYGRKTSGYLLADENSTAEEIGDEPKQYRQKFWDILVAVDENRCDGIRKLRQKNPELQVVLLDDAFQHRAVKAGLYILLTDYHKMYTHDFVLPSGTLRERRAGAKRADIIVVTKTPKVFSPLIRKELIGEINPLPNQLVCFSYIRYGQLKKMKGIEFTEDVKKTYAILMFAGIANTYPLEEHLKRMCDELEVVTFADHHQYTQKDLIGIKETFNNLYSRNKIIVTTEKDAMRIDKPELLEIIKDLPVFYAPIEVDFHKEDKELFNKQILDYVGKNKTND
jgi:tetraacyldisaccharide 4'-kinase